MKKNQEPMSFDEDKVEWRIAKDKYCRLMFGIEDEDEKVKPLSYFQNNKLDAPIRFSLIWYT